MSTPETIALNLERVEARIEGACRRAGRARGEVTLVAVSKTRTLDELRAAYRAGARHFGENRVEEAEGKVPLLRAEWAADPATWHLIGHVQSRKAARAVEVADVLHAVDSLHLAERLERAASAKGVRVPILLEVNVSGEASKQGFAAWDDTSEQAFLAEVQALAGLTHLEPRGLMTMAPIVAEAELARPVFRRLRALRDALGAAAPFAPWRDLSMGMTDDFEVAIEEGATLVRIGRAIFA
jgi:PLP dependent protein